MPQSPLIILAKQASPLNGSRYIVIDLAKGHEVGELECPMLPQATNARLKFHSDDEKGSILLRCGQDNLKIQFEYLRRGWQNDTRYTLQSGDRLISSACFTCRKGLTGRAIMTLDNPVQATFVRRWAWFRACYELLSPDGKTILGRIEEPTRLSVTRQFRAELPGMALPQQMFCLFLALHLLQT